MSDYWTIEEMGLEHVRHVAVGLEETGCGRHHIGIFVRKDDEPLRFVHLAWHLRLMNDAAGEAHVWTCPNVRPERLRLVGSMCRLVWQMNAERGLPYAFSSPSDFFDRATGEARLGPTRLGLTCASFVIAIFEMGGIRLVQESTWEPTEEDRDWQESIVEALEKYGASADHIEAVSQELGAIRFRPPQVFCATSLYPPSAKQEDVSIICRDVEKLARAWRQKRMGHNKGT